MEFDAITDGDGRVVDDIAYSRCPDGLRTSPFWPVLYGSPKAANVCPEFQFRRGDVDGNGVAEITDAIALLGSLFLGATAPSCPDAADADDNGSLEITDAIYLLGYLFLGMPEPPLPGPRTCGADPTMDDLGPCLSICR